MRHIEVEFHDGSHTFVDDFVLSDLINTNRIRRFYRPSERRWISIGVDPIRNIQKAYKGVERRRSGHAHAMMPIQQAKNLLAT